MLHVSKLLPRGQHLAPVLLQRAAEVVLDWDTRQKSRFQATDSQGRTLGVFLPRGSVVRGGDVLVAEDGSLVCVVAAPQAVLRITPGAQHGTPFDLTRAAYHLGNRHVPIELTPAYLQIEPDHVLADMLRAMRLMVQEQQAAFEPESGAYGDHAAGHGHGHGHSQPGAPQAGPACAHEHGHENGHEHAHPHPHSHAHDHTHGPHGQ